MRWSIDAGRGRKSKVDLAIEWVLINESRSRHVRRCETDRISNAFGWVKEEIDVDGGDETSRD